MRFLFLTLSFLAFPISHCLANDTRYMYAGEGKMLVPATDTQVEMVSETIRITMGVEAMSVDCSFSFKNTGTATKVLMGFPDERVDDRWIEPGEEDDKKYRTKWALQDFTARLDGKAATVEHSTVAPNALGTEEGAYTWEVSFAPEQTREITNSYHVGLGHRIETSGTFTPNSFRFKYVVRTGARWKGSIKSARFFIDLSGAPHSPLFTISPAPQSVDKGIYAIFFENLKPDFDISIEGFFLRDASFLDRETIGDGSQLQELAQYSGKPALDKLDDWTICVFKNMLYALYGRSFRTPWLRDYFSKQPWYRANPKYLDATNGSLPSYEVDLINHIKVLGRENACAGL